MIMDEIDAEVFTKKKRARSKHPNRSSSAAIRTFVKKMAELCPHFMGGKPELFGNPSIEPETLLARIIAAIDYFPSSLTLLANPDKLAPSGIIVDSDLFRMTLRQMTDHCTRPMLDELEARVLDHEGKLLVAAAVDAALEPPFDPKAQPEDIDIPVSEIIDDPLLGRIEVDSLTGELIRTIPDSDALGEVLVDDTGQVQLEDTATAKKSTDWGSW